MITSFSLILVNDNFFAFTVSNYRCGYGCIFNVLANFQSVIAYCKYLIKSYGFSSFNAKFLYSDTSPSATLYCLPPVAIIAYIWHLPINYSPDSVVFRLFYLSVRHTSTIYHHICCLSIVFFRKLQIFFRMQLPVRQVRCGRQRLRTADAHRLQNPGRLLLLRQSIHRLLLCRLRYRQCEVP